MSTELNIQNLIKDGKKRSNFWKKGDKNYSTHSRK